MPIWAQKKAVVVNFNGISDGQEYWATLLGSAGGPWSRYSDYSERYSEEDEEYLAWRKFGDFVDIDGFPYCQAVANCTDKHEFSWSYYPPINFKILVYFPETDTYAVSDVCSQYVFKSYFLVDLSGVGKAENQLGPGVYKVDAKISFNYYKEFLKFFSRVICTIIIELVLALIFRFRTKKAILTIVWSNCATQVALNLIINLLWYSGYSLYIYAGYLLSEIIVFTIEAIIYSKIFTRNECFNSRGKITRAQTNVCVLYAFLANLLSFVIGCILAIYNSLPLLF